METKRKINWSYVKIGLGFAAISILNSPLVIAINHYDTDVQQNQVTITRPTGLFEYVKFTRYESSSDCRDLEDELFQYKPFGESKFLTDGLPYGPHDGKVDHIFNQDTSTSLDRLEDYSANKEEFDSADKFLAEMKDCFREYL